MSKKLLVRFTLLLSVLIFGNTAHALTIKIGHNKTDYFWDGRDTYGDLLGNGIYFYKVTAKINGENIEHYDTSGDQAFKKGFGKMYLLR